MNTDILRKLWQKGRISFLACALCLLYLLKFTWLKWGDLIIDTGRDLYVPLQILSGKTLYRDIQYFHGPFSPYFNAFLFKLLGVHVNSLVLGGITAAIFTSLLIYKISRLFLNISSSTFTVLTFLFVFAFGQYVYLGNYNFILPFAYPAIHGILFSLAALYFLYRSFFNIKRNGYICAMFITFVFLCRIEMGLMLISAAAPAIFIYSLSRKVTVKRLFYHLLIYIVLPLAFTLAIYGFLINSFETLQKSSLLDVWANNLNVNIPFVTFHSGAYDIPGNIRLMSKSALYYLLLCIFLSAGGFITAYFSRFASLLKKAVFTSLAVLFFVGSGFIIFRNFLNYNLQYRSLPVICLLTILISLRRFINDKSRVEYLFLATFSMFSLFLLTRKLFYAWAGHYGFYLLVPGMVVYYVFFLKIVPGFLNSNTARRFFAFFFLGASTLFIMGHFAVSRFCYLNKTLKVSTPRGTLYVFDNSRERRNKEFIEFLSENTAGKETLVVFPEGLTANFLSGRMNPLYYNSYVPLDIAKADTVKGIISDMETNQVGYVAVVSRDMAEFGYNAFGDDYGKEIWDYISEKYALERQFGPLPFTTEDYGIALFKRR